MESLNEMVYDWDLMNLNSIDFRGIIDESIRDGLQDTRLNIVSYEDKCKLLSQMASTGIEEVIIGMIGIDEYSDSELMDLIDFAIGVDLFPWVLCRLNQDDLNKLNEKYYNKIGINVFVSFSKIRLLAENWEFNKLLGDAICFVNRCKKEFPAVRLAIEDATRTHPEILKKIVESFVGLKVERIAFADTAGIATPSGVNNLFDVVHELYEDFSKLYTSFEWHGHNDRGMALANSLVSIERGVRYVHGTILGVGERTGNTAIELVLCNSFNILKDKIDWIRLREYFELAQKIFNICTPSNYPYFGEQCIRSATGTHCAAMIKLEEKGYGSLSKKLFMPNSPYPVDLVDMILISKLSGKKTVQFLMGMLGYSYDNQIIKKVLKVVKENNVVLGIDDLKRFLQDEKI